MNIFELNCKMFKCTRSILKSVTIYMIIILVSEESINTTYSIHNKCFNFCRHQCVWIICSSGMKTERCGYVYGILILPIDTVQAYKGKRAHTRPTKTTNWTEDDAPKVTRYMNDSGANKQCGTYHNYTHMHIRKHAATIININK